MTSNPLKIFIHSIDGAGHLNACIGLAQALHQRGHSLTFLMPTQFQSQLESQCFNFLPLLDPSTPKPDPTQPNPIKAVAQHLLTSGLLSGKSSLEKTIILGKSGFLEPFYTKLVTFNPQIDQAIQEHQPDLFLIDHIMVPPAVLKAAIPYVLVLSGNPIMLFSPELPPAFSGFPASSDPKTWTSYAEQLLDNFQNITANYQTQLNQKFEYQPEIQYNGSNYLEFKMSPYLNIYGMPGEIDYANQVPRIRDQRIYCQVDAFTPVDPNDRTWELPIEVNPGEKLIYVAMGSMVGMDVELMRRITSILGGIPNVKVIVSKGPRAGEYELPANSWGEAFVPQTRILPLVDLVITHGGNNTVTEAFSAGKPMVVMPFLGDGYDNAQRIEETGFGVRLEPYSFEERDLVRAIDQLLYDEHLKEKLRAAANRIWNAKAKDKACERIEALCNK